MKAILLANPASGKEKLDNIIEVVKRRFNEKGYHLDVYFSNRPQDLEDKAQLWAEDYDMFLACGGDGTIHEVVNGIMRSEVRPTLAVIPSGTVNDIAKILGIPKNIEKNLDLILNSEPIEMDINQINDTYFTYVAGAGFLTEISYTAEREDKIKYGQVAYYREGVKSLKRRPYFVVELEANGKMTVEEASLVLILSANQFGGMRLWRFSRKTKLNDGLVDIRIFKGRKLLLIFKLILFVLLAGRKQFKQTHISTSEAVIRPLNDYKLDWNADGEKVFSGELRLKVIPRAIRVIAHPKRIKKLF